MDAVRFLQERNRMYESGAPTPGIRLGTDYDPASAVNVVEEWSAAHPRKTRQDMFPEQYPDAGIDGRGALYACPAEVYGEQACPRIKDGTPVMCYDCRSKFWMQEMT